MPITARSSRGLIKSVCLLICLLPQPTESGVAKPLIKKPTVKPLTAVKPQESANVADKKKQPANVAAVKPANVAAVQPATVSTAKPTEASRNLLAADQWGGWGGSGSQAQAQAQAQSQSCEYRGGGDCHVHAHP